MRFLLMLLVMLYAAGCSSDTVRPSTPPPASRSRGTSHFLPFLSQREGNQQSSGASVAARLQKIDDSSAVRNEGLKLITVGTSLEDAVSTLELNGFACQLLSSPLMGGDRMVTYLECQATPPPTRWTLTFFFSDNAVTDLLVFPSN
ncbi:MAG TPA: hypothetical protein VFR01_05235 [Geobacterales bacterium]|nr:hypothetical protein [Geobacterales bacterium]